MTAHDLDDDLIRDMLARRAGRGEPTGLAGEILVATAARPQAHGVTVRRGGSLRLLAFAAVVVTTAGIGFAIAGGQPRRPGPEPSTPTESGPPAAGELQTADVFIPPFTYRLDPASGLVPTHHDVGELVLAHRGDAYKGPDEAIGSGIAAASIRDVRVHPCGGSYASSRVPVRETPAEFLEDLHGIAGVAIGPIKPTTVDGRPALATDVDPSSNRCGGADLHMFGGGLGSDFMLFTIPSRLIAVDVDGRTVVLQIWGASQEAFVAGLAEGQAVVDSVRFANLPAATDPGPSPIAVEFARDFTYQPRADGPLLPLDHEGGTVRFHRRAVAGADVDWGITLASTREMSSDHCGATRREAVPKAGTDFLAYVREIPGMRMTAAEPSSFDGFPALVATIDPDTAICDIAHLLPAEWSLYAGGIVSLSRPTRLTLVDVNGATILIGVWASTRDGLEQVLPDADTFLAGLQFAGTGTEP